MKIKFISLFVLAALAIQCAPKRDIIQENVEHAEKQLALLIAAAYR